MTEENKKIIWEIIQKQGSFLQNKLKPHPNHPKGRNPYAHICSLINQKFSCSYKDVPDEKLFELKKFILDIQN